jgi:hypothetical protein
MTGRLRLCGIKGPKTEGRGLKAALATLSFAVFLLLPFFYSYGAQHIVLYHVGERDQEAQALLKKHIAAKGFIVSAYDGAVTVEKQVELANRINRLRANLFIAVEITFGEEESVTVAVSNAKREEGQQLLAIEEVPALYTGLSREFARLVSERFEAKVFDLPLFPLLGIDMPGVFMRIVCPREQANDILSGLTDSMQKYFSKGTKK